MVGQQLNIVLLYAGCFINARCIVGRIDLPFDILSQLSHKQGTDQLLNSVISRDGTNIAYNKSGHGPTLILVHGSLADHRVWTPVIPAFEEHFTVVAVDRRGRGNSGDSEAYSVQNEAEDIVALVESFDESVNILAHSYGAACTLQAALLTNCISKLALYEPAIITGVENPAANLLDKIQTLVHHGKAEEAVISFFADVMKMPVREIETMRSRSAWKSLVATAHTLPREVKAVQDHTFDPQRFGKIQVPTLLLLGGESDKLMRSITAALHEAIPNNRLAILEGQQHSAMSTSPKLFTDMVVQFFSDGN
ncbi:MAG: alpha/beta hydrolase [Dehalococcoidia bacterium]|nr:alpha/beta hydrolase [Dehalococcoidia bacterium]